MSDKIKEVDIVFSHGTQYLPILVIFPITMERHYDQENLLKKVFNLG